MSSTKSVVASGALALLVSLAAIAAISFSGLSIVKSSTSSASDEVGTLSILLTDPPHIPRGVTAVYATYSQLGIHASGSADTQNWMVVERTGTINLLNTLNVSETLASANVKNGLYDKLLFNISASIVTYMGKNYTAFVPSNVLYISILGGVRVNASKTSATLINIEPTVVNIGSTANPEFVIRFVASAFPIPSNELNEKILRPGARMSLVNKSWWAHYLERYATSVEITGASLSGDSLSVSITNPSSQSSSVMLLVISPLAAPYKSNAHGLPDMLLGASIFIVKNDGTLEPLVLQGFPSELKLRATTIFSGAGYNLAPGASIVISYNGVISFGFGLPAGTAPKVPSPGQRYLLTALGERVIANFMVTSS